MIMVQDEEGRWWAKHRETGEWNYYDGSTWVQDTPPGYEGVAPEPTTDGSPTQPLVPPNPEAKHEEDRRRARPWILVVGLVGMVVLIAIAVNLVVSNIGGPEMDKVPDVVGKPRNEAEKVLKSTGFNVEVKMRQSSEEDAGNVVQQSPSGGGEAKRGSEVAIAVGEAPPSQKKPTPEEDSRPAPGYNRVRSPDGGLTVEAPQGWGVQTGADSEGEGDNWSYYVGESITSSITTARSLEGWYGGGEASGAYIVASRTLAQKYTYDELIYSALFANLPANHSCTTIRRPQDYERPPYSGLIQAYSGCDGVNSTYILVAAAPEGRECAVFVQARISSEADRGIVLHMLDTFEVNCGTIAKAKTADRSAESANVDKSITSRQEGSGPTRRQA
jgi:hypothetical protein